MAIKTKTSILYIYNLKWRIGWDYAVEEINQRCDSSGKQSMGGDELVQGINFDAMQVDSWGGKET